MKYIISILILLSTSIAFADTRYCAELDKDDNVIRVIVCDSLEWLTQRLGGRWVETFMDKPDHNYAGKGYKFHKDKSNFAPKQPYASWSLDEKLKWQPPVAMPKDGKMYRWDEKTGDWTEAIR